MIEFSLMWSKKIGFVLNLAYYFVLNLAYYFVLNLAYYIEIIVRFNSNKSFLFVWNVQHVVVLPIGVAIIVKYHVVVVVVVQIL